MSENLKQALITSALILLIIVIITTAVILIDRETICDWYSENSAKYKCCQFARTKATKESTYEEVQNIINKCIAQEEEKRKFEQQDKWLKEFKKDLK